VSSAEDWLEKKLAKHERLTRHLQGVIHNILESDNIDFLSISSRTKSYNSALKKLKRKKYSDPDSEFTDLTGLRVITFFSYQVDQIAKAIESSFQVDKENSMDKGKLLGDDRVGYRSVHYVCTIGSERAQLKEFQGLENLKFEIQLRTVLQHAWAELSHDRSYKFAGELPSHIKRKLNLYSGMLEVVDDAFSSIAQEVDSYAGYIASSGEEKLFSQSINSLSLDEYISRFISNKLNVKKGVGLTDGLLQELNDFGVVTIGDLHSLITQAVIEYFREIEFQIYLPGFLRTIMMITDIDKYFYKCRLDWSGIEENMYSALVQKFGKAKIDKIVDDCDLDIIPEDIDD